MGMVKWICSADMPAAPRLNGTPGSLLAVLDAFLVNGYGSKVVTNLTIAGGVATAVVAGGHSFVPEAVARISGATVTGGVLNGEHRVSATGLNTISFPTTLPNQTAAGTIVIDLAPAGWEKMSATNIAAYRPLSPDALGFWTQVDNVSPDMGFGVNARLVGYEAMSDAVTGVRKFPTQSQMADGFYLHLGSTGTRAAEQPYTMFADDRSVLLCLTSRSGRNFNAVNFFGDLIPVKPGDAFAHGVVGHGLHFDADEYRSQRGNLMLNWLGEGAAFARSHTGLEGSVWAITGPAGKLGMNTSNPEISGTAYTGPFAYPNAADNGLILSNVMACEYTSDVVLRAGIPGFLWVHQRLRGAFPDGATVDGSGALAGRRLRHVRFGNQGSGDSNNRDGGAFVDITGPWR